VLFTIIVGIDCDLLKKQESKCLFAKVKRRINMQKLEKNIVDIKSDVKTWQFLSSAENANSFVSVITEIADHTSLLALYEAIEGLRTKETGHGLDVVVKEVQKLAGASARAALNVNGMIQGFQAGARENIKVTTEAGRRIISNLELADRALEELSSALAQMNKTNDSMQHIAAAATDQDASNEETILVVESVTKALLSLINTVFSIQRAVNDMTQAGVSIMKQAEALTAHANNLSDFLSIFKTEYREAA